MEKVVRILMERDKIGRDEAESLIIETRDLLLTSDPLEADMIMADMLGLEPDYIVDLITF